MNTYRFFLNLLSFSLLWSFPAQAVSIARSGDFSVDLKGYYKNLFFTSVSQPTGSRYVADLNRLRTEWDARYKIFSAKVIWDNELIAGNYVNTGEFAGRQTLRNQTYADLDYDLVRRNDFFYGQNFYRAYVQVDPGTFRILIGRQRIDWGVMRLFSPEDLFSPLPIFQIEKEERVGVTAANMTIPVGASLRLNTIYAFDPQWDRSRIGGRVTKTIGHYDVSVLGGRFLRDGVVGLDFSGDIGKAGVRGGLIYDIADLGKNFVQGALGVDYGFENSFYFALEYFLGT